MTLRLFSLLPLCVFAVAVAQTTSGPDTVPIDKGFGISTIPLWGAGSSQAGGKNSETATLTVFIPQPGHGVGTAVIIAPGGAYLRLATNLEGRQVADWFAARGVTAFVLKYRLGAENPYPIPLQDAQRTVRLVRSLSGIYKVSPDRIGIMGFSAGGHLAAMEATSFDDGEAGASDAVERVSSRPDFLILGYPWLNAMEPNEHGLITYCSVLHIASTTDCTELEKKYSPALHVTARTPSAFIYHTTDDATVPVQASVQFYSALVAAGVPAEMHLFRHGAHGSGLGRGDQALDAWPTLLESWMRGQGWLTPSPEAAAAPHAQPVK